MKILSALLIGSFLVANIAAASAAPKKEAEEVVEEEAPQIKVDNRKYIHKWEHMPTITSIDPRTGEKVIIKHQYGYAYVFFFVASWCTPCKKSIQYAIDLEKKFGNYY